MTFVSKYSGRPNDYILLNKTYSFTSEQGVKLRKVLNRNIPDSIVRKYESGLDGGGFEINYIKKVGDTSKIITRNLYRKNSKYIDEFIKIDAFFDFAYSIVNDSLGIDALDCTMRPYFTGLPIRKVSDNPLEYRIWGSISGNASWNNDLLSPFLNNLPKDKCIIIDCNNMLSYAWQEDILRLYIIKNTNLNFANMAWLKNTRKSLIEFKDKIKIVSNNEEELKELKNTSTYNLYMNHSMELDNWLELPEESISITVEQYRKNCQ